MRYPAKQLNFERGIDDDYRKALPVPFPDRNQEEVESIASKSRNNCSGSDKFRAFLLFRVPIYSGQFLSEHEIIESTKNVFFLYVTNLFNDIYSLCTTT